MDRNKSVEEYREDALKILERRYRMYFVVTLLLAMFCIGGPLFIIIDNLRRDINRWSDIIYFLIPSLIFIPIAIQFPRLIKVRSQVKDAVNVFMIHAEFRTPQVGLKRYFVFNNSRFGYVALLANPSRWYSPKILPEYDCVVFADSTFSTFDEGENTNWETMPLYIPLNRLIYRISNETKDFLNNS